MPTFLLLQCFACRPGYGIAQRTKAGRWSCGLCRERQSVKKVFASSQRARELREPCQRLNLQGCGREERRREEQAAAAAVRPEGGEGARVALALPPEESQWQQFEARRHDAEEEEGNADGAVLTRWPSPSRKKRRGRGRGRGGGGGGGGGGGSGAVRSRGNEEAGVGGSSGERGGARHDGASAAGQPQRRADADAAPATEPLADNAHRQRTSSGNDGQRTTAPPAAAPLEFTDAAPQSRWAAFAKPTAPGSPESPL